MRKASITDVARKAGVSISTVSRAMSDKGRVNPETYEKVQRAIRALKYRKAPRSPGPARVRTVAVVVPTVLDPFFSVVLHGIETMAKTYTCNILLFDSCNSVEIERENAARIVGAAADGVIFVPAADSAAGYRMLLESGIPVVLLDRLTGKEGASYVISDDLEGAFLAVKYLIDLGHRCILYIGGEHATSTEEARLKGYTRALAEHDIPISRDRIIESSFESERAYETMTKMLLSGTPDFSAVFAGNDLIAFGVRKALEENGLRVPEDVSLVGYGDMPFASLLGLTTVSCPALEMARSALGLLVHIIGKKFISSRQIVMRPTLVLRSSCRRLSSPVDLPRAASGK